MSAPSPQPRFAPRWLVVIGIATAFGLLESAKSLVFSRIATRPGAVFEILRQNMPWWYAWAALVPVVVFLAARIRLDEPRKLLRRAPIHLAAATALAAVHIVVAALFNYYTAPAWLKQYAPNIAAPTPARLMYGWLATFLVSDMLTYWIILGAYYAVDYQRRYRESAILSSELAARSAKLEQRAVEARLQALKMELNPHFLFNALNSITALVRKHENATAITMVAHLGDLLRATLDRGAAHEMPLADELRLLELYLDIERDRFADRLHVEVDVPAHLHDALVPTLLLQPIVENSVRHGVSRVQGPVTITIRAWRSDDRLTVEVADDGAGFRDAAPEGVGLTNSRARLDQLYGSNAGLETGNIDGRGAVTRLWLPYAAGHVGSPQYHA